MYSEVENAWNDALLDFMQKEGKNKKLIFKRGKPIILPSNKNKTNSLLF